MKFYQCRICGFKYESDELARKCLDWCGKHNSCNLEITSRAIRPKQL